MPGAGAEETIAALYGLFILLLGAKVGEEVLRRLGQPGVVGELLGGFLVGPLRPGPRDAGRDGPRLLRDRRRRPAVHRRPRGAHGRPVQRRPAGDPHRHHRHGPADHRGRGDRAGPGRRRARSVLRRPRARRHQHRHHEPRPARHGGARQTLGEGRHRGRAGRRHPRARAHRHRIGRRGGRRLGEHDPHRRRRHRARAARVRGRAPGPRPAQDACSPGRCSPTRRSCPRS